MDPDIPTSHTLARVFMRLSAGAHGSDPDLARALNEAFGKHEQQLRMFCRRELSGFSEQHIEEVVQDVFEVAWQKLPEFRFEGRFRSYLWGIASRKCARLRRKRRDVLTEDGMLQDWAHAEDRSALAQLADEQRDALLSEAARNVLDDQQQELAQLRWVLDYPQEEVATLLGLSDKDEVRKRLVTCKRRMEKEIARLLAERGLTGSFLKGGGL